MYATRSSFLDVPIMFTHLDQNASAIEGATNLQQPPSVWVGCKHVKRGETAGGEREVFSSLAAAVAAGVAAALALGIRVVRDHHRSFRAEFDKGGWRWRRARKEDLAHNVDCGQAQCIRNRGPCLVKVFVKSGVI